MAYKCKLKIFEGPLDLLLHLLKEQKMDICDIPIAEISKQYMQYLELMKEMNLELVGEYLVMAAELTRIKSKTLLPSPETDEEDDFGGGEDPRSELMRRLREYQRYRDAAFELRMKAIAASCFDLFMSKTTFWANQYTYRARRCFRVNISQSFFIFHLPKYQF